MPSEAATQHKDWGRGGDRKGEERGWEGAPEAAARHGPDVADLREGEVHVAVRPRLVDEGHVLLLEGVVKGQWSTMHHDGQWSPTASASDEALWM